MYIYIYIYIYIHIYILVERKSKECAGREGAPGCSPERFKKKKKEKDKK